MGFLSIKQKKIGKREEAKDLVFIHYIHYDDDSFTQISAGIDYNAFRILHLSYLLSLFLYFLESISYFL
jgi:hypothetical protein